MGSISSAIQFRDKQSVLDAFEARGVEAWSVWSRNQFLNKGIGADSLESFINLIANGDSNAIYTVKVYEDIIDIKKIKSNTQDDGSFNFKLNEDICNNYSELRKIGYPGYGNAVTSEFNALKTKVDELTQKLDDVLNSEPETDNSLGIVGKILEHPAFAGVAPQLINMIVGAIIKPPVVQPQQSIPENVNYSNFSNRGVLSGIDDNAVIMQAIERLKQYDKNLPAHLQKLCDIAEKDRPTFDYLIKLLD